VVCVVVVLPTVTRTSVAESSFSSTSCSEWERSKGEGSPVAAVVPLLEPACACATEMRGSCVKKACPVLNEAEGSQSAAPDPGAQASVALGARMVLHSSYERVVFSMSVFSNSIVSGRSPA